MGAQHFDFEWKILAIMQFGWYGKFVGKRGFVKSEFWFEGKYKYWFSE